jgi:hypothetical protein
VVIFVGIDLGLQGAVCAVGGQAWPVMVADLPRTELARQPIIDVRQLRHDLRVMVPATETALVLIEDVRVRPTGRGGSAGVTASSSETKLVRLRGHVEALVLLLGWRLEIVQPQTWKRHFGLIGAAEPKKASLAKARELYPSMGEKLHLAKHHNRAEAVLMAHYARGRWA